VNLFVGENDYTLIMTKIWRLFIFLPVSMGAMGFLQSAFHFCAGFGMKGVFKFGPEVGKTDTVMEAEFRKKDKQKALFILFLSAVIGLVVSAVAVLSRCKGNRSGQ